MSRFIIYNAHLYDQRCKPSRMERIRRHPQFHDLRFVRLNMLYEHLWWAAADQHSTYYHCWNGKCWKRKLVTIRRSILPTFAVAEMWIKPVKKYIVIFFDTRYSIFLLWIQYRCLYFLRHFMQATPKHLPLDITSICYFSYFLIEIEDLFWESGTWHVLSLPQEGLLPHYDISSLLWSFPI